MNFIDPLEVFGQKDAMYFIENFSKDGVCDICQKSVEKNPKSQPHNVRKHYVKHAAEYQLYEAWKITQLSSKNTNVASVLVDPSRLLALYAATTTFPRFHLRNPYLKVSLKY